MSKFVVDIEMDTRVLVQLGIECEEESIDDSLSDLVNKLAEDGAREVQIVGYKKVIEANSGGSSVLN